MSQAETVRLFNKTAAYLALFNIAGFTAVIAYQLCFHATIGGWVPLAVLVGLVVIAFFLGQLSVPRRADDATPAEKLPSLTRSQQRLLQIDL